PKKHTTTTPVKQSKPAPPPTKKPSKRKLLRKVRKGNPTFQLVEEDNEAQQESIPQKEGNDPDLELAKKMSLEAHQEKGEGEGDDADMERAIKLSLDPAFLPQGRAPVGGVTIRDPVSETTSKLHEVVGKGKAVVTEEQVAHSLIDLSKKKRTTDQFILVRRDQTPHDSTTGPSSQPEDDTSEKATTSSAAPKGDKDQGEVDSSTVTSGVSIPVSDPEKAHEALAGPDPEPMKEDQTGSDSGKLHVSLAGPNPEHMDDEFLATAYPKVHENLKLITDERVIDDKPESHSGSMSSMKNLDDTFNFGDQFLYDKPTEDDQEKSKVREESDSTIPDPSHQTVTSTPPVIAPFTDVSSSKPSLLVTPPPINTEATTITTSLPEITPFIALQLRVARLEQEMSEVKKTDHSADVLASIRSQVPTAVDKYLGTKLDDALLKVLERHTADLIEKYSVLPGPESIQNQESEKSPKEIIRIKKEQGEEKQDSTYSIRSTDKVDLEEFDLKSALFKHMNKIKSANRNTANYHLYHALMEALIADEDAMDKEVADKVKDHKRKHDSDDDEDDDDDEGPSARSNQGKSAKRRRHDSGASGSAQPPTKDDEQSSKKPRESDASASKQHLALTSTGWQITDTRDAVVDSSMPRSDTESEHSEQSSDDIPMQDEGHISDMEDTDNAHIPKANTYATTYKVPEKNKLQRKTYDIGSFIKWFCRRIGKKKLCKADLEDMDLFNLISAPNPTKVKTGTRPHAAHEVLLLTATLSRVIDMEDTTVASESSRIPSVLEKSPLDFANENPPSLITKRDGAEDQGQDELSREIPVDNPTTTEVIIEPDLEKEVAAMGPLMNKRRHKRGNNEADTNALPKVLRKDHAAFRPTQSTLREKSIASMGLEEVSTFYTPATQETPTDAKSVSDPDPLSYAKPSSRKTAIEIPTGNVATTKVQGQMFAESPESGKSASFPSVYGSLGGIYQLEWGVTNDCRLDTPDACQDMVDHIVPPGFEQEVKLLKKATAKIARQDQRIQAREEEIKRLDQEIKSLRVVEVEVHGL
ncbi:hypothetical protein Tco_0647039, partial [Tanacetum coccineum]